jgi:hypothetical protein
MLNNLIYLKTQLNRDGLISLENLVNIKKLNKYLEITATILNTNEETSGILYLDSSIGDSFSFESYASIAREQERQKAEQEKAQKEKEEQEKRDAQHEN